MAGFLTDAVTAQLAVQAFAELEAGRGEAAVRRLQGATLARPQVVDGFYYLGDMLNRLGRNLEAERVLRRAVALNPCAEVRLGLAFVLMCQGCYPEGWALYRARHEIAGAGLPRAADFPYPEWTGQELSGKHLVIFPEQGFGDQIQFARFVPQLLARGAEVTLLCRPGLERLLSDSLPDARVLAAAGAVEFPDPDYWAMVGGLVGPLGTTLETVPGDPYLTTGATWPALAPGCDLMCISLAGFLVA